MCAAGDGGRGRFGGLCETLTSPPGEPPQPSPPPRPDPAPRQRLGPRTYGPERQPRRPPHPPTHPPPPPPHPPPNHTNNTLPTPRGLQAVRHHLGPAHRRAPDKSVRPNGQPAKRQQHRPTRNPARTMAHLTGRQRTQRTRRPTTSPHGHTPLPRPTQSPPGPPTPGTPTPTAPPGA